MSWNPNQSKRTTLNPQLQIFQPPGLEYRLEILVRSSLRRVFFVRHTTIKVEELLENNIIIDLSHLRHQEVSRDLIRLFVEFLLLYISRGLALRKKGLIKRRNIILIEESQIMTPEILTKRTLADGTTSEEVIGTLGGFGLSLVFISAQPHLLSRSIMAGCHTKIVFGVQGGTEANLLADLLGVDTEEIMTLQTGDCLVRSVGTGIVKIRAITLRMSPEQEIQRLETYIRENPPDLLVKSHQSYKFIKKKPLGLYSSLVETIEEHTESGISKNRGVVRCWADHYCNLCKKTSYLVDKASEILKKIHKNRNREDIQKKIKLYHLDPMILYSYILELVKKAEMPNAEFIAFCAHWLLLDQCLHDDVIRNNCQEFFKLKKTKIVETFMGIPGIQRLIDLGSELFDTQTSFSYRDEFCELCPLDKSLRNDFCLKYRQDALQMLTKVLIQRLKSFYETGYELFLQSCFKLSNNPSFAYCLATTFLKGCKMTINQRSIIMEKTKHFLSKTKKINIEDPAFQNDLDLETISIETENQNRVNKKE